MPHKLYEIRMEQMHQEKNCGYILETLRRIQQKNVFFQSFVLNIYLCLLDKLRARVIGMAQLFFAVKMKLTERLSYYTQSKFFIIHQSVCQCLCHLVTMSSVYSRFYGKSVHLVFFSILYILVIAFVCYSLFLYICLLLCFFVCLLLTKQESW